jgi:uncharacterized protein YunC (DUF1805 family)
MIKIDVIESNGKELLGIKIELPNAPLLLLLYKDVVFGCGYINAEVMEKLGNPACIVTGVKTFEDVLNAEIKEVTTKASEKGAKVGMKVYEFLDLL